MSQHDFMAFMRWYFLRVEGIKLYRRGRFAPHGCCPDTMLAADEIRTKANLLTSEQREKAFLYAMRMIYGSG